MHEPWAFPESYCYFQEALLLTFAVLLSEDMSWFLYTWYSGENLALFALYINVNLLTLLFCFILMPLWLLFEKLDLLKLYKPTSFLPTWISQNWNIHITISVSVAFKILWEESIFKAVVIHVQQRKLVKVDILTV